VAVGVGFVDRAVDVGAVGFLKIYGFYISEYVSLHRPFPPSSFLQSVQIATAVHPSYSTGTFSRG
jgi:hypothetical protein